MCWFVGSRREGQRMERWKRGSVEGRKDEERRQKGEKLLKKEVGEGAKWKRGRKKEEESLILDWISSVLHHIYHISGVYDQFLPLPQLPAAHQTLQQ